MSACKKWDQETYESNIREMKEMLDKTIENGCKIEAYPFLKECILCDLETLDRIYRQG